ncbi:MAG: maleylacetoacetate isomerase [Rhodobacteraceae bacterium]|nr:maleylacetoacetate isomerase [Paracoccaceae bacterium]
MNITLYDYWRSSASYRLRIAFGLAGMDYSSVPVDLVLGEHCQEANLTRNPQGLVPSVDFDGQILTQSLAIIEYLHEAGHYSFLPQDLLRRAKCRALAYVIAMEIHPVCNLSVAKHAVANSGGSMEMQDWMQHFIPKGLAAYEAMLDGVGLYSVGDEITMADLCLVPQIYNAQRWQVDLSPYPKINAIMARLAQIPAVALAHPDQAKP